MLLLPWRILEVIWIDSSLASRMIELQYSCIPCQVVETAAVAEPPKPTEPTATQNGNTEV